MPGAAVISGFVSTGSTNLGGNTAAPVRLYSSFPPHHGPPIGLGTKLRPGAGERERKEKESNPLSVEREVRARVPAMPGGLR